MKWWQTPWSKVAVFLSIGLYVTYLLARPQEDQGVWSWHLARIIFVCYVALAGPAYYIGKGLGKEKGYKMGYHRATLYWNSNTVKYRKKRVFWNLIERIVGANRNPDTLRRLWQEIQLRQLRLHRQDERYLAYLKELLDEKKELVSKEGLKWD